MYLKTIIISTIIFITLGEQVSQNQIQNQLNQTESIQKIDQIKDQQSNVPSNKSQTTTNLEANTTIKQLNNIQNLVTQSLEKEQIIKNIEQQLTQNKAQQTVKQKVGVQQVIKKGIEQKDTDKKIEKQSKTEQNEKKQSQSKQQSDKSKNVVPSLSTLQMPPVDPQDYQDFVHIPYFKDPEPIILFQYESTFNLCFYLVLIIVILYLMIVFYRNSIRQIFKTNLFDKIQQSPLAQIDRIDSHRNISINSI